MYTTSIFFLMNAVLREFKITDQENTFVHSIKQSFHDLRPKPTVLNESNVHLYYGMAHFYSSLYEWIQSILWIVWQKGVLLTFP